MATEVNFFEDPPMTQRTFVQNFTSRLQFSLVIFSLLWLSVAFFWLYRAVTHAGQKIDFFVAIYLFLTILCSVVGFVLAFIDKRLAVRDRPHISEQTLHAFSLAGGWPGTCIGNWLFRHKTQKTSYQAMFWLIVMGHLSIISYGIYLTWWPANSEPSNISKPPSTSLPRITPQPLLPPVGAAG
ncbi:hypothetical protein A6X21_17690 [Planctopirus hydrillae]|uniref:DUF1294 domain-containing protein n=2 Tax=Planctopirus hydrillae TaxID=1841610 RepID=A0A1C3ELV3_9PLAN|nr:hypothetical protein A6X21_17690 [Planctopirus hydrillae]